MPIKERVEHKFSKPDELLVMITPLGAATVEAMPDKKLMTRIRLRFKNHQECPVSKIFSHEQLEQFYAERGATIKAVPSTACASPPTRTMG